MTTKRILALSADYSYAHKNQTQLQLQAGAAIMRPDDFFANLSDDEDHEIIAAVEDTISVQVQFYSFDTFNDENVPSELRTALATPGIWWHIINNIC